MNQLLHPGARASFFQLHDVSFEWLSAFAHLNLFLFASFPFLLLSQDTMLLYPDTPPDALGHDAHDIPTLTAYWAENPVGSAVVICPGGGYWKLAMDHEGKQIAEWFQREGIHAFVLKYRLGQHGYRHPVMMHDGQRAIRMIRSMAPDHHINPDRVGIMGFSAGGHLAATVSTHFDEGDSTSEDPLQRYSCRPDFCILGYPVISMMPPLVHEGSRNNLLGQNSSFEMQYELSNEEQVKPETPPAFLVHTTGDQAVIPENSIMYYLALRRAGIPAELHIYQEGRHGLGMFPEDNPVFATWEDRLRDWLEVNHWK